MCESFDLGFFLCVCVCVCWKPVAITCARAGIHPNMPHRSSWLREMDVAKPKLFSHNRG